MPGLQVRTSQLQVGVIQTPSNYFEQSRNSLIPGQDLEMDYYDYNVGNAGAVPGSYLGMDPAYLVWIPPLDECGEILPDDIPKPEQYVDPGSNTESPEAEVLLPKQNCQQKLNKILDNKELIEEIQMKDLSKVKLPISGALKKVETSQNDVVVKIDCNLLNEIKYADEDDDETNMTESNQCNKDVSYQDSNILSSS